jgi:hypothetical protein
MTGLLTLPARLWLRGAKLALHTAEDITGRAVVTTLRVVGTINDLRSGGHRDGQPEPAQQGPQPPRATSLVRERDPQQASVPEADPRIAARADEEPMPAPAPARNGADEMLASERLADEGVATTVDLEADVREPAHVSEETTLVREESEPGAEDGAGAALRVAEPWSGYARMNARDILARLSGRDSAELAAVQLYESTHRKRQTVLQAVDRELRAAANRRG